MGTRLRAAIAKAPTSESPLEAVATILTNLAAAVPEIDKVIVHIALAKAGSHHLAWCEVDEKVPINRSSDETARILSQALGRSVSLSYSDSLGEAGYAIFENGVETGRNDSPIADEEPMYPRFCEGLDLAFPGTSIESPEGALDLFYGPEASTASFIVARHGQALSAPEPYVAPPPPAYRPSVFDREFTWGKKPRAILRGCAMLYGAISVALILGALGWFLLEWWRTR